MMLKIVVTSLLSMFIVFKLSGAQIDTVQVSSPSMNKQIQVLTITPDTKNKYPVIYLLHGYGGNAKTWLNIKSDLSRIADEKGLIFVCPDGENSWYWNSPTNSSYRYETFLSKELVDYVDNNYPTIPNKNKRAITGLSMGGHGAIWVAFRNKNVFGAVGSTSGGLDIRPFPNNWEMSKQLGTASKNREVWDAHTAINQIDNLKNKDLAIIIDCGYDDFFLEVNNEFHNKLLKHKIDHDYTVRPGGHTNQYWENSIDYQILFFEKFFNQ